MKCMSSYLASDPQRALTNHFFRQVAEFEKAKKAKKKKEAKKAKKARWVEWAKKIRWRGWSLEGVVGEHTPEVLLEGVGKDIY